MRKLLTRICLRALESLEVDTCERVAAAFGILCYYLGLRRRIVSQQLQLCLGHLPLRQRQRAARLCYANIAANLCGILATKEEARPFGDDWHILNPHWIELVAQRYPSAIYVSAHLGAFEAAAWITSQHLAQDHILCYVRQQRDAYADDLINKHRQWCGAQLIYQHDKSVVFKTSATLKKGKGSLAILADQGPRKQVGRPGHFLGQPTYCHHGPVIYAQRAKVPIIPFVCLRVGIKRYAYFVGRPYLARGQSVDAVMQHYLDQLSALIAAFPGQYFWHHRRFKHHAQNLERAQEPWRAHGLRVLVDPPIMDNE